MILPMVLLRRLDCVLGANQGRRSLSGVMSLRRSRFPKRQWIACSARPLTRTEKHPLYNTSSYTFARLLGDAEHIAPNLVS